MTDFLLSNFGSAILAEAAGAADNVLVISPTKAARFPEPTMGEAFALILWDGSEEEQEIVYCTSNPLTGQLTVSRGEEGTSANNWMAGTQVRHALTAETVTYLVQNGFISGNMATLEEAEAGTSNEKLMSPQRTLQFFNARTTEITRAILLLDDIEDIRGALGFITVTLSGTGLEDTFLIDTPYEYNPDYTKVYVDEVFVPTGYTITGPDVNDQYSIVFDSPPASGTDNIVLVLSTNFTFSVSFPGDNTVGTSAIIDGAVTTVKIDNGAITTPKIADGAVTQAKLASGLAFSGTVLQDNTVAGAKLVDGAVITAKLGDLAVTTGKLANSGVTSGKIADEAVTEGKIAGGAVTVGKIADGNVTEVKLANGAVTVNKIADGHVTNSKLGAGAVTHDKITDGHVIETKIGASAVTNTKIANGAVDANKIGGSAVLTAHIADSQVTSAKLSGASSIRTFLNVVSMSADAGDVGTYAFMSRQDNPRQTDFGQTRAGSSLKPTNSDDAPSAFGPSQSGTWRCMGYTTEGTGDQSITLWRRES